MRVIRNSFFLIVYFLLAVAANAHTVTWVSGTGNDNNPCTRIAPCATFAGALTKTLPGGEIDALDAGNYGPLIINKAVTINGNSVATIAVEDLEGGILINAGASDVVILRNIELNGLGSAVEGILFDSGKALQIDHCKIPRFAGDGILVESSSGSISILDTVSSDNRTAGLAVGPQVAVTVDRSRFEHNQIGGIIATGGNITVSNSDVSNNFQGFLLEAADTDVKVDIFNSTISNNQKGIEASSPGIGKAIVRLANVALFTNTVAGLHAEPGAIIESFGNNYNSGSGTPNVLRSPQ